MLSFFVFFSSIYCLLAVLSFSPSNGKYALLSINDLTNNSLRASDWRRGNP